MSDTRKSIGGLWKRVAINSGEEYLGGAVNGVKVVIFPNRFKEQDGPTAPDYKVYVQKDRENSQDGSQEDVSSSL